MMLSLNHPHQEELWVTNTEIIKLPSEKHCQDACDAVEERLKDVKWF